VKRLWGVARSRPGRFGLTVGLVVAILVGLAAPGFACDAIITATNVCSNGNHVITWTISSDRTDLEMDIAHALSSINGTYYPTTSWASVVLPGGSTTATTTVPDSVVGELTINVYVSWPGLPSQPPKINGLSLQLSSCTGQTTSTPPTTASLLAGAATSSAPGKPTEPLFLPIRR